MPPVRFRLNHIRVPFRRPYVTATGSTDVREVLIARLENDSGVIGLGEASLLPHETAGFEQLVRVAELAARLFLSGGLEALSNAQLGGSQVAGMAAIETAARDALARAERRPLAKMLNPDAMTRVEVNGLVTANDIKHAVDAAQGLEREGFRTIKLKVGTARSVDAEVGRIKSVRVVLSPGTKLRLDANGAWNEATAASVLGGIGSLDIEYIEQPVIGDLSAMQRLSTVSRIKVAADEDVGDVAAVRRVIEARAASVLVLKPVALGGIERTIGIAREARDAGIGVALTTSIDTGIGTAMALQVAAAVRSEYAAGLATADLLQSDLLRRSLPLKNGTMSLPDLPGLGVELDEAALGRFSVREWVLEK